MPKTNIINDELLDKIISHGGGTWNFNFDNNDVEIVPKALTHSKLLVNFKVDDNILKYYNTPCKTLFILRYNIRELVSDKISDDLLFNPFPFKNHGAYIRKNNLFFGLVSIINKKNRPLLDGKKVIHFYDLNPYFKEYAEGFKVGFDGFTSHIQEYLTPYSNNNDFLLKVFEYIESNPFFERTRWLGTQGFATSNNNEIVGAYKNGLEQGYFYRAWCYIFANNNFFKPLFNDILLNSTKDYIPKKTSKEKPKVTTFKEIFTVDDYEKYINALHEVENPVIDENWYFIGKPRKHKGVICCWINHLQTKGIINKKFNRQVLAEVCNNEIKDFNLGRDGKTFDNTSKIYDDNYKELLLEIIT